MCVAVLLFGFAPFLFTIRRGKDGGQGGRSRRKEKSNR